MYKEIEIALKIIRKAKPLYYSAGLETVLGNNVSGAKSNSEVTLGQKQCSVNITALIM